MFRKSTILKFSLLTALTFLAAAAASAQSGALWQRGDPTDGSAPKGATSVASDDDTASPRPEGDMSWGVTLKQRGMLGNLGYWMTDTSLDIAAPYGVDLNADLNDFGNSTSSASPTVTMGAGWTNGISAYTASYAVTTLANNYQANALDLGVSVKMDSLNFRTLLSLDVNETHHRNYAYIGHPVTHAPARKDEEDLSECTPTASLSQRLFGNFDAKITLAQSIYNQNIVTYTNTLGRTKTAGQRAFAREDSDLTGLIVGFPDWSAKFGVNYDFDAVPLTLRGTYENIALEDTGQGTNTTAAVMTYAADYDVKKWATLTASYEHTRQTSQPQTDEYGAQLTLRY
jgi:hypothetical protein